MMLRRNIGICMAAMQWLHGLAAAHKYLS